MLSRSQVVFSRVSTLVFMAMPMSMTMSVLATALMLTACADIRSSKVDQSEIYPNYRVSYDAGARTLLFNAVFTVGKGVGGTYVELDKNSQVKVNGGEMRKSPSVANQIGYEYSMSDVGPERLGEQFEISYTDNAGKTYTNKVRVPLAVTASVPSQFSQAVGLDISWTIADRLSAEESIYAQINFGSGVGGFFDPRPSVSSGRIRVTAEDLAPYRPGRTDIAICRSQSTANINAAAIGGSLTATYCSIKQTSQMN